MIADFALRTVLSGIGARLGAATRNLLAEELPPPFDTMVEAGDASLPIEERMLAHAKSAGEARELVASVGHVLVDVLSTDVVERLRDEPSLAPFLGEPAPEREHARTDRPRGLAAGHFGSSHPLAEAHPDRVQAASVASTANPHDDSKLSSAHGTTQEQLHETLAEGRPPKGVS